MLLTKKTKFSISELQMKEDVLSPNGDLLLKINIRYPNIKCTKNDSLARYAQGFYADIASSFNTFAKTELAKAAFAAYTANKNDFLPYAAVMRYEITLENKDYLSVMLDLSVADGCSPPSIERKTQVWERKNGTKCRHTDFITKRDMAGVLPEQYKKRFDHSLFVLRDDCIEFFLRDGDGYASLAVKLYKTD